MPNHTQNELGLHQQLATKINITKESHTLKSIQNSIVIGKTKFTGAQIMQLPTNQHHIHETCCDGLDIGGIDLQILNAKLGLIPINETWKRHPRTNFHAKLNTRGWYPSVGVDGL